MFLFTPQLSLVLRAPTHRGMAQAEVTWVAGSAPRWFTRPKTVTHPGTNRARRRVTTLTETDALLNQTATRHTASMLYKKNVSVRVCFSHAGIQTKLMNVGLHVSRSQKLY